jgi:UDP-N-acetylmuramate dehydrogenase
VNLEKNLPLARLTTLGTGGPARWLGRPGNVGELVAMLAWAREERLPVGPVGLGSNLLASDEGFDGLVLKLAGDLAAARAGDRRLVAGGGAPLAVCLHRARAAGLGGLEFVCAIPGTVGGGVKMNAGAYGGDIASVLARAEIATADGTTWLTPAELGLTYRSSGLEPGQVVSRAELLADARSVEEI